MPTPHEMLQRLNRFVPICHAPPLVDGEHGGDPARLCQLVDYFPHGAACPAVDHQPPAVGLTLYADGTIYNQARQEVVCRAPRSLAGVIHLRGVWSRRHSKHRGDVAGDLAFQTMALLTHWRSLFDGRPDLERRGEDYVRAPLGSLRYYRHHTYDDFIVSTSLWPADRRQHVYRAKKIGDWRTLRLQATPLVPPLAYNVCEAESIPLGWRGALGLETTGYARSALRARWPEQCVMHTTWRWPTATHDPREFYVIGDLAAPFYTVLTQSYVRATPSIYIPTDAIPAIVESLQRVHSILTNAPAPVLGGPRTREIEVSDDAQP